MDIHNLHTGSGTQLNYNGPGQNINHGRDQNINHGRDQNIQQYFGAEIDSRRVLWDAIKHVGFSHKAEHQFSRGECLEGTREKVLQIIHGWRIPDGCEPPICWLAGAAGVGKTSIAMTVANSCEQDELVTSFFFFRTDANRNNPAALILAIAHGLAVTNTLAREEISERIRVDWSILGARLEEQFEGLVVQPVAKSCARQTTASHCFAFNDPTLVIIDGLDECGDEETQLRLLSAISSAYQQYPRFPLRFLICSRPEPWIRQAVEAPPLLDATKVIRLDEDFNPTRDIRRYYNHEFQNILRSPKFCEVSFPNPWPSEEDLRRLVRMSDGQFAHASTTVRFVRQDFSHPVDQLRLVLDTDPDCRRLETPFRPLDTLYNMVLKANSSPSKVLPIIAAIVIIPRQVDVKPSPLFIELLLGLSPGIVSLTLRALHSVLDIRGRSDGITVYHTSFTDYLYDQTRSGDFFVDKFEQHDFLAQQWLLALSSSRVGRYNFGPIAKPNIHAFFSEWHNFCDKLPGRPSPQLLGSLRNLDFSALFFSSLDKLLQTQTQATVRSVGHSDEFNVYKVACYSRQFEPVYEWVKWWLESGDVRVDSNLIKRFANHPKCFLLRVSRNCDDIETADISQALRSIRRSELECTVTRRCEAFWKYEREGKPTLSIVITECYCHCSGTWEPASRDNPLRSLCQLTCLQTVRTLVSDLLSLDLGQSISEDDETPYELFRELERIFREMLDRSLLQHCAFEPELFSLCETFFSCAGRCSSLVMTSDHSETRRNKLRRWLETCPGSYTHEADALKFRLNLFFAAFNSTSTLLLELSCFYDNILIAYDDRDNLLRILGAIFTLRDTIEPSPTVIELLLGLSCGEVARTLQAMSEYLVFDIRGQEDAILVHQNTFTDYLLHPSRSRVFHINKDAHYDFLVRRWLQAISGSRFGGYSLDQLYTSSTRLLFTEWIPFCTARPGPASDLLNDLRSLDLGALFFCIQVMFAQSRWKDIAESYDPTWNGIFSKVVTWLESSTEPVDAELLERFKRSPKHFHLQASFDSSHHDIDVVHWAVLSTTCYKTDSGLTRRAKKAVLKYLPGFTTHHPGHRAYQTACLETVKAFVSDFCFHDPTKSLFDSERCGIFRNVLDSSLLPYCAFEPELFSICHIFLSTVRHRPPARLTSYGWMRRRANLLEWLQTCPDHHAREANALKTQVMTLFPEGTLKVRKPGFLMGFCPHKSITV